MYDFKSGFARQRQEVPCVMGLSFHLETCGAAGLKVQGQTFSPSVIVSPVIIKQPQCACFFCVRKRPHDFHPRALRKEDCHSSEGGDSMAATHECTSAANTANTVLAETSTQRFLSANGTSFPQTHSGRTGPPRILSHKLFQLTFACVWFCNMWGCLPILPRGSLPL